MPDHHAGRFCDDQRPEAGLSGKFPFSAQGGHQKGLVQSSRGSSRYQTVSHWAQKVWEEIINRYLPLEHHDHHNLLLGRTDTGDQLDVDARNAHLNEVGWQLRLWRQLQPQECHGGKCEDEVQLPNHDCALHLEGNGSGSEAYFHGAVESVWQLDEGEDWECLRIQLGDGGDHLEWRYDNPSQMPSAVLTFWSKDRVRSLSANEPWSAHSMTMPRNPLSIFSWP